MTDRRTRKSAGPVAVSSEATARVVSRLNASRPYRVGEPHRTDRSNWPAAACWGLDRQGYTLTLFQPAVTDRHCEMIRREPAEFALVLERPLVVLAYRFGTSSAWETLPYAWPLATVTSRPRVVPPARIPPETRALLWVSLVDADDGLIRAQRGIALAPRFTQALNEAIRHQVRAPFDGDAYVRAVASTYIGLRDPERLVERLVERTSSQD